MRSIELNWLTVSRNRLFFFSKWRQNPPITARTGISLLSREILLLDHAWAHPIYFFGPKVDCDVVVDTEFARRVEKLPVPCHNLRLKSGSRLQHVVFGHFSQHEMSGPRSQPSNRSMYILGELRCGCLNQFGAMDRDLPYFMHQNGFIEDAAAFM